ncbi:MAG: hypothetical protein JXM73_24190 [Anaerolineae bacterium]|nr:hypothetical protein [Anaerolineae bacterium]
MINGLIGWLVLFLGIGLAVVALVLGLLLALSYLGGWGALARLYTAAPETDKGRLLEEKRQYKAWVGLVRYGTLVTARSYERGLELTVRFPFSPPLFFPWEEISDYRRVALIPYRQLDQFVVGGRVVRLSNHLEDLSKRKGSLSSEWE